MLIFVFDKDGTLVRPNSGEIFPQHPTDQEPLPGMREAIAEISGAGCPIVIASNQGGIGRYKSREFAISEFFYLFELFPQISKFYFAPGEGKYAISGELGVYGCEYSESINFPWIASYRKPAPGLLSAIAFERHAHPAEIIFCGDRETDWACAQNFGCGFYWQHQLLDPYLRRSLLNSGSPIPNK